VLDVAEIEKVVKKALESAKPRNFKESVELAINLKDVDLSIPKNRIDDDVLLPNGRGKDVKVAIFCGGEMALKAKDVADKIIPPEEIEELAKNKRLAKKMANEYYYFLAEAPLMPEIGKRLGVILGPRGKMPKPLPVGADPAPIIKNLKRSIRMRSRDKRTFHVPVGVRDMSAREIAENIEAVLKRLVSKLERGWMNIESVYVKTTMGPSVRLI